MAAKSHSTPQADSQAGNAWEYPERSRRQKKSPAPGAWGAIKRGAQIWAKILVPNYLQKLGYFGVKKVRRGGARWCLTSVIPLPRVKWAKSGQTLGRPYPPPDIFLAQQDHTIAPPEAQYF